MRSTWGAFQNKTNTKHNPKQTKPNSTNQKASQKSENQGETVWNMRKCHSQTLTCSPSTVIWARIKGPFLQEYFSWGVVSMHTTNACTIFETRLPWQLQAALACPRGPWWYTASGLLSELLLPEHTVSDSEAVIHLAHVQHLWQSKLFVIFLVLARWRIRLCSELQRARQWLHMHFVMHVCWKKLLCRWALAAKIFANFAPCFGPQNGGWKMDPKMVPEFDPQNGGPKMAPKMGSKNGTQKIVKMKIKLWFLLDQDIGPPFGCHFWTPILGVKFWHHFWVHFSTPILGSKTWCKICKNCCCQSSSA